MSRSGPIRIATRGSELALRQADGVRAALADRRLDAELVEVETQGDRVRDELIQDLGKTGAFVRSLDERVLAGDVDAAVHSLKDVPTEMPDDLAVAAVPDRASTRDVLVTPDGRALDELPAGAVVGTASLRRGAQLRAMRPDLDVEPIRGNVDTRIEKLLAPDLQAEHERRLDEDEGEDDADGADADEGVADDWFDGLTEIERRALGREVDTEYDAVVLAEAGLERIGLADQVAYTRLSESAFLPAPGQGALAVTARDGEVADAIRTTLDHPPSRIGVTAERIVLAGVGGGCIAPVGIRAKLQGEHVHLAARVLDEDGDDEVSAERDLRAESYAADARAVADDLVDRGARELIGNADADVDADDAPRGNGP